MIEILLFSAACMFGFGLLIILLLYFRQTLVEDIITSIHNMIIICFGKTRTELIYLIDKYKNKEIFFDKIERGDLDNLSARPDRFIVDKYFLTIYYPIKKYKEYRYSYSEYIYLTDKESLLLQRAFLEKENLEIWERLKKEDIENQKFQKEKLEKMYKNIK
jgi:hypothetical protein